YNCSYINDFLTVEETAERFGITEEVESSNSGVTSTCGVDADGNHIVSKRIISCQLEIDSILNGIKISKFFDANRFGGTDWPPSLACGALELGTYGPYRHLTEWDIQFDGTFSGTYPGIFIDGYDDNGEII